MRSSKQDKYKDYYLLGQRGLAEGLIKDIVALRDTKEMHPADILQVIIFKLDEIRKYRNTLRKDEN
jgi:hypothetical protein